MLLGVFEVLNLMVFHTRHSVDAMKWDFYRPLSDYHSLRPNFCLLLLLDVTGCNPYPKGMHLDSAQALLLEAWV